MSGQADSESCLIYGRMFAGFCHEPCNVSNRLFRNQNHSARSVYIILCWMDCAQSFTTALCPGHLNTPAPFKQTLWCLRMRRDADLKNMFSRCTLTKLKCHKRHAGLTTCSPRTGTECPGNHLQDERLHRQCSLHDYRQHCQAGWGGTGSSAGRRGRCVQPPVWRSTAWGLIPVEWTEI